MIKETNKEMKAKQSDGPPLLQQLHCFLPPLPLLPPDATRTYPANANANEN